MGSQLDLTVTADMNPQPFTEALTEQQFFGPTAHKMWYPDFAHFFLTLGTLPKISISKEIGVSQPWIVH